MGWNNAAKEARRRVVQVNQILEPLEKEIDTKVDAQEKMLWAKRHEKKQSKHIVAQKQAIKDLNHATKNHRSTQSRLAKK